MKKVPRPYFTVSQLEEMAVAKYIEATLTLDSGERERLRTESLNYANRARIQTLLLRQLQPDKLYQ